MNKTKIRNELEYQKTLNSCFQDSSFNRRIRRKLQQIIKKKKQKLLEIQKFSIIYAVASNPKAPKKTWVESLNDFIRYTWMLFIKIAHLLKVFCVNKPYLVLFTIFSTFSLFVTNKLAKKFHREASRKLSRIVFLIQIILWFIILLAFVQFIKAEGFTTIYEWIISIITRLLVWFKSLTSLLISTMPDKVESDLESLEKSECSKSRDFKEFVSYTILTVLTTKYILHMFKRKVVNSVPFSDEIIYIIETASDSDDKKRSQPVKSIPLL